MAQLIVNGSPEGENLTFMDLHFSDFTHDGIQDVSIQPGELDGVGRLSIRFSVSER
jgi:hypothetical protein